MGPSVQKFLQWRLSMMVKPAQRGSEDKDDLWCEYCKKPRHTRDQCWKLHGKPQNRRKEKSNESFQGTTMVDIKRATKGKVNTTWTLEKPHFTKEQLEIPSSSCAFVKSGNIHSTFLASKINSIDSWIINLRATNHITNDWVKFLFVL